MASRMILVVAATLLGTAMSAQISSFSRGSLVEQKEADPFHAFMEKHGREYELGSEEYAMRKQLFEERLAAVHTQNAKENALWKAAPSHFSDRTETERKVVRGYKSRDRTGEDGFGPLSFLQLFSNTSTELPESKDYMHLKAAHKIHDQGSCGSCWAHTTASTLEAHAEIYNNKDLQHSFNVQEIIHCTPNPRSCGGTGGCEGATVELGMDYIQKNGLAKEGESPHQCGVNSKKQMLLGGGGAAFGMVRYETLKSNEDAPLAAAVAHVGPVGITACAGAWFEYSKGIFDGCSKNCVVDHAITLYGYGKDPKLQNKKYWLIKNSWGKSWGEHGYIRMLRLSEKENSCGTDNNNQEGVGCKGDPKSVPVCGMCGMLYDSTVPHFNGSPGAKETTALADIQVKNSGEVERTHHAAHHKEHQFLRK